MKRRKSTTKPWLLSGVIAVPVVLLLVVLLPPWLRMRQAQHDVNELVIALRVYTMEFGQAPTGTLAEISAAFRGRNPRREAVVEQYQTNSVGEFVDPYGSPYQINPATFRVYSFGPNRQNENGAGDDIVSWQR